MFLTEVWLPSRSALIGQSVHALEATTGLSIHGVFRKDGRLFGRKSEHILATDDLLLVSGRVETIRHFLRQHGLQPAVSGPVAPLPADRVWTEIVVMPPSTIIGSPISAIEAFLGRGIQVVGISPQRSRIEGLAQQLHQSEPCTLGEIEALGAGLAALAEAPDGTEGSTEVLFGHAGQDRLEEALRAGAEWAEAKAAATRKFANAAWSANLDAIRQAIVRGQGSFLSKLFWPTAVDRRNWRAC